MKGSVRQATPSMVMLNMADRGLLHSLQCDGQSKGVICHRFIQQ